MQGIIVLTGAAGGIGCATARVLTARGVPVHLIDLPGTGLAGLAAEIGASYAELAGSSLWQAEAAMPPESARLGGLVHLAGAMHDDPDLARGDAWEPMISSNLQNAYLFATLIGERLAEDQRGRMVFASSLAFRRGAVDAVAYSSAKGGLVGMTRALARRFKTRATVNAVAPGIIKTAMPAQVIARRGEKLLAEIPLGRFGEPEDVARVIAFLVSEDASYITGQCLNVDGGQVMS